MKIISESIAEYYRTFEKVRIPKTAYHGSVYLDFENEHLYFQNESMVVRLPLELEDKDDTENVFVFDGDKFFLLVAQYDHLVFKDNTFISPDDNEFKLKTFKEPYEYPNLTPDNEWEKIEFDITTDLLNHIRSSIAYIPQDQDSLRGLFFDKGQLIALQPQKFYQASVDVDENFNLPYDFIKILLSFDCVGKVTLHKQEHGDAHRYIFNKDDITIRFVTSSNLSLPVDIHSEEFINNYDHETYFAVNKQDFISAIKFLDPFAKDVVSSLVTLQFEPNDNKLNIVVNDEQNVVNYNINVKEYSSIEPFEDEELNISLTALSNIFSNINSEDIYIAYSSESPAMKFSSGTDSDHFIIQTKIKT